MKHRRCTGGKHATVASGKQTIRSQTCVTDSSLALFVYKRPASCKRVFSHSLRLRFFVYASLGRLCSLANAFMKTVKSIPASTLERLPSLRLAGCFDFTLFSCLGFFCLACLEPFDALPALRLGVPF